MECLSSAPQRQIPLVIDADDPELGAIPSHHIVQSFEMHELSAIRVAVRERYLCFCCKSLVNLCANPSTTEENRDYHFRHYPGRGLNCPWRSESSSKEEIYAGIQEGEKHKELKHLLANTLNELPDWVIDLNKVDKRFLLGVDHRDKAKPDVYAIKDEHEYAFEIQLRSESPTTIKRRKDFYQRTERRLVWLSAYNMDIVSEGFENTCKDMKQVQLDIAFANNGNWFVFDEEMAEISLTEQALIVRVNYYHVEVHGRCLVYQWKTEDVPLSKLTFKNGEVYFYDFKGEKERLSADLKREGKESVIVNIERAKIKNYGEFYNYVKGRWPSVDPDDDKDWLHSYFKEDRAKREDTLREIIISMFRKRKRIHSYWKYLCERTKEQDFGISNDVEPLVVEKLFLILGIELSDQLNVERKSHCRALHYFFDCESFKPHLLLALEFVNKSEYRDSILNDETVSKRLPLKEKIINEYEQDSDSTIKFMNWFCSKGTSIKI